MPEQTELQTATMSRHVATKLQDFHDGLTEAEQQLIDRAIRHTVAGDMQGYRMAEYEDEFGFKGPPGTNPQFQPQGGGGAAVPALLLGIGFLLGGGTLPGSVPGQYP